MNSKIDRKNAIAQIIHTKKIRSQEELADELAAKNIFVTQATLSRDIKELGAVKVTDSESGQHYILPRTPLPSSKSPINLNTFEISGQICVLHCHPGFAPAIASLLDKAGVEGVMGSIAGDDTVLVLLRQDYNRTYITEVLRSMFNISEITVRIATKDDEVYAEDICKEIFISSQERKTGIAKRTPEYIREKIRAGKAVVAVSESGEFAGFSYIESWGGKSFVATSGLIVAHKFRGQGIARRIKEQTFQLARNLFPDAKLFSITTGAAVMKMNYELGYRPVPFSELTDDPEFWKGCEGCRHFDILKSHEYKMCICTGLLYDPNEKIKD